MVRSLEELLHDPSTPDIIREVTEMGLDTARNVERYIEAVEAVEAVADACTDWVSLDGLCRASMPFYMSSIALSLIRRKDYRELAPWLRDAVAALRTHYGLDLPPAEASAGLVGRWL